MLDSDRAGISAAVLNFFESCDVGDAVPTPTDRVDTERFELIERLTPSFRASRYYRFEGGCLWWHFDFDRDVPSALSIELDNSVVLVPRQEVNDNLRETFLDEEL